MQRQWSSAFRWIADVAQFGRYGPKRNIGLFQNGGSWPEGVCGHLFLNLCRLQTCQQFNIAAHARTKVCDHLNTTRLI
jgi:hypothetical protein